MSIKNMELRIQKIMRLEDTWKLFVDMYDTSNMCYDEKVKSGFVYLDNIESFDPKKSVLFLKSMSSPSFIR